MKVRKGFVSNSSSSSFVCEICGNVESGYDASPCDVDMIECAAGHMMCRDHVPNLDELDISGYDELPVEHCPICQLNEVSSDDMVAYTLKKLGVSADQLKQQIKSEFGTYKQFQKALK